MTRQRLDERRQRDDENQARKEARQLFDELCAQANSEARDRQKAGDLAGALAVYDSLVEVVRLHPRIAARRDKIVKLLSEQAAAQLSQSREPGEISEALAAYDNLPAEGRDPNVRQDLLELLQKQTIQQEHKLVAAGDEAAALALYDNLPSEILSRPDVMRRRLRLLRKSAKQQADAGDFAGALAVYDRPLDGLRDHVDVLYHRAYLLYRLGHLHAALEVYGKVLSADRSREDVWHALGKVLADLCRSRALELHIKDMVSSLPPTMQMFQKAASLAERGVQFHLASGLSDDALNLASSAGAPVILKTAEELLQQGAQGRVINLLDSEKVQSDPDLRARARELSRHAIEQLRLAGRPVEAGPFSDDERADALIVRSILQEACEATSAVAPVGRGIAIVAASLGAGGIQRQVVELIRQLCASHRRDVGPIVLLLLGRSGERSEFFESPLAGLDVTIEFMSEIQADPRSVLPAETIAKLDLLQPEVAKAVVPLASRLKAHNPEVVLAMMTLKSLPALLASCIVGIPHIVISERSAARRPDELLKLAYRTVLAQGTGCLATNTAATARDFEKWLNIPSESVRTIYNGTDVDEVRSRRDAAAVASYRRSLGIADGTRVVGSVFQARRIKRPQLWIDAAAIVARRAPDVAFVVIGDGMDGNDLTTLIVQLGLEGRFHRLGVHKDVPNWLNLMDLVLLTSQYEGSPNVLLEAQALGRPVVATDVGGSAETFLPGETGLLVSANAAPEEIADAVLRVLDDPSFAARASEKGPQFIRDRFDPQRMASEFVDLCFGKGVGGVSLFPATSPPLEVQPADTTAHVSASEAQG